MRLDKYSNPIFNEKDLMDAIYQGKSDLLRSVPIYADQSEDIYDLSQEIGKDFLTEITSDWTQEEFDKALQSDWNMPQDYYELDIEEWLVSQCPPWDPHATRLEEELAEFKARNMLDLLRWMKYFVDTCRQHNIVWGVGRGSSVASYVLYLIGVHKIDCIKYNLDWREFLR